MLYVLNGGRRLLSLRGATASPSFLFGRFLRVGARGAFLVFHFKLGYAVELVFTPLLKIVNSKVALYSAVVILGCLVGDS